MVLKLFVFEKTTRTGPVALSFHYRNISIGNVDALRCLQGDYYLVMYKKVVFHLIVTRFVS